ncbi:MAG: hypothetical protein DRG30_09995 [Epsilonproteobacteria bacterium]|nr:MAG: hypothetical protein DRG30_09995 [Campylobacterota bacterium]
MIYSLVALISEKSFWIWLILLSLLFFGVFFCNSFFSSTLISFFFSTLFTFFSIVFSASGILCLASLFFSFSLSFSFSLFFFLSLILSFSFSFASLFFLSRSRR